ncbi:MAG TPA: hypothetical protein VIG96_09685, partial [Blastococcus sp.]
MPASRRPPGAGRRVRSTGRTDPFPLHRADTTPLAVPRPATRPMPAVGGNPAGDERPTTVLPGPEAPA